MKWVALWLLVGGVCQTGAFLWARLKFGGAAADAGNKVLGIGWRQGLVAACLGPLPLIIYFLPIRWIISKNAQKAVMRAVWEAQGRCLGCGERHDGENDEDE